MAFRISSLWLLLLILQLSCSNITALEVRSEITTQELRGTRNTEKNDDDSPPPSSLSSTPRRATASALSATDEAPIDKYADVAWCNGGSLLCKPSRGDCIVINEVLSLEACSCHSGWTGIDCMDDLDECQHLDPKPCSFDGGYCVDRSVEDGMYACGCDTKGGHWRNGTIFNDHGVTSCIDVVECDEWPDACGVNATCTNLNGSYDCSCPLGLVGNPFLSCNLPTIVPDEVLNGSCKSDQDCQEANTFCDTTLATAECRCSPNFFQASLGLACHMEDGECDDSSRNNCHRDAICIDETPGYSCKCDSGFVDVNEGGASGVACRQKNECLEGGHDCDLSVTACVDRTPPARFECVKKTPAPTPIPTNQPTPPIPLLVVPPRTICSIQSDCSVAALNVFTDCEDTETPQGKAYKWLKDEIEMNAGGTNTFNKCDYDLINQRYSLLVFYFAADPSETKLAWLSDPTASECDWDSHIECTSTTPRAVTALKLDNAGLKGSIPAEIGNLAVLTALYLYDNGLTGPIPTELGSLTSLYDLSLFHNGLTGPIPTELLSLTSLQFLDLHENDLTGPIPTELGSLTSILYLELGDNGLTGPIPTELLSLTSLQFLDLYENDLTGPILTELGSLTSIIYLYLEGNGLTGPIPTELGSLTSLEDLWLNDNDLTGPIPTELGNLASLRSLRLASNQLTGTIPQEVCGLWCTNSPFDQLYGANQNDDANDICAASFPDSCISPPVPIGCCNDS